MHRGGAYLRLWLIVGLGAGWVLKPRRAWGVGEDTGRIIGRVTEAQTGAPVPGAVVTASSEALIGEPRRAITREDGSYELTSLPRGTYTVEVGYEGLRPMLRRVAVQATQATPLNIAWSAELAERETTLVIEERHLTRPDSPMTGQILAREAEDKLPIARRYQAIVNQVPGVLFTGNPNIKGGNSRQNKVLIDGLDTNDPVTHASLANINFDSIEAVQVITGAMEAKFNAIGGIINLITNSGSDEWHANASVYFLPNVLRDTSNTGSRIYQGTKPFDDSATPPDSSWQAHLNLNGPIVKHRLWFSTGVQVGRSSRVQPPGPPLNVQAPSRVSTSLAPRLKLTWVPSPRHKLSLQGFGDPTGIDFVNNDSADANSVTPLAALAFEEGGYKALAEWDYLASPSFDLKLLAGYQWQHQDSAPQGRLRSLDPKYGVYDFNRSGHLSSDDGILYFNNTVDSRVRRQRISIDLASSFRRRGAGYHDIELGFQGALLFNSQHLAYTGHGLFYNDRGGGRGLAGLCDQDPALMVAMPTGRGCDRLTQRSDADLSQSGELVGLYLQDRWKPWRWLTVLPGLRWDLVHIESSLKDSITVYGFGPRLSVIGDLTGDHRTVLQFSYGRVNDSDFLQPISVAESNTKVRSQVSRWQPSTGRFELERQAGGPDGAVVESSNRTPPHSDELTVSLRREIFRNSLGGVDYTYKRMSNLWDQVQTNYIWDPSGDRLVGYVDGQARSVVHVTTPDSNHLTYQGIDFYVEARPFSRVEVSGSYTVAWRYGPGIEQLGSFAGGNNQYLNRRQAQMFDGFALDDIRHVLRLRPSYVWRGLVVGLIFDWSSGAPVRHAFQTVAMIGNKYRAPTGIDPGNPSSSAPGFRINDTTSWSELRTPDTLNLSLHVAYDLHALVRQHVALSVDLFNSLDLRTPTAIAGGDTAALGLFGQVTSRATPFRVQLGVRYAY